MKHVIIAGKGVAAAACHTLLRRFGWTTAGEKASDTADAQSVPFIAINATTWQVIADIFGEAPAKPFITTQRLVAHHGTGELFASTETHYVLPASAIQFHAEYPLETTVFDDSQTVSTHLRLESAGWISSGLRTAWICEARSDAAEAARSLIFEFVPGGWVFWAPTGDRSGFLQFVLPNSNGGEDACRELWLSTRLARRWTTPLDGWHVRALPAAARARKVLVQAGTKFCGSAAMVFDPISGDGTGASLRSSLLACAAMRYVAEHPEERSLVWRHYEARMARAFREHLNAAARFYAEGALSPAWNDEKRAMKAAAQQAAEVLPREASPRFRLENLTLTKF